MTHTSRWALVAVTAAAMLAGFGVTKVVVRDADADGSDQRPVAAGSATPGGAHTELPGLNPARGEPTLPGFETARPAQGTITQVPGPFDERYDWSGLRLAGDRVTGNLTVTSDVSDLLELEVLVGFYNADGQLLGMRRVVRHHTLHQDTGAGLPDESLSIAIDVPRQLRPDAAAAAVGVPVLVNE